MSFYVIVARLDTHRVKVFWKVVFHGVNFLLDTIQCNKLIIKSVANNETNKNIQFSEVICNVINFVALDGEGHNGNNLPIIYKE